LCLLIKYTELPVTHAPRLCCCYKAGYERLGLDKNFLERRRAIEKNKAPATATADPYGMTQKTRNDNCSRYCGSGELHFGAEGLRGLGVGGCSGGVCFYQVLFQELVVQTVES